MINKIVIKHTIVSNYLLSVIMSIIISEHLKSHNNNCNKQLVHVYLFAIHHQLDSGFDAQAVSRSGAPGREPVILGSPLPRRPPWGQGRAPAPSSSGGTAPAPCRASSAPAGRRRRRGWSRRWSGRRSGRAALPGSRRVRGPSGK